jgi:hypothetical protein
MREKRLFDFELFRMVEKCKEYGKGVAKSGRMVYPI